MPTCPTCRHVHAGPDFGWKCIGCYCPHDATCDCGHCETRAILNDHETMAALEEGMRAVARGDVISLDERTFRQLRQGDWTPDEPPPAPGDPHAA